jgi:hypothetical protein
MSFAFVVNAFAAAPLVSFNTPSQANVTINVGESINFAVNASDVDGNLNGSEWYGHGDNPYIQGIASAAGDGSSSVFNRNHTFLYGGNYTITSLVYDANYEYSSALVWNVTVNGSGEDYSSTPASTIGDRALYVDDFDVVLSSPANTDKLLAHIQAHNITKLTVYDLHTQLPSQSALISDFIGNAKKLGVTSVGAAGGIEADFDRVMVYQGDNNYPNKFDTLYLEHEYWNLDPNVNTFVGLLDYMDAVGGSMPVEAYLGWIGENDYAAIANSIDNVFLHCYIDDASNTFSYCKERLQKFGELNANVTIYPIFSAEWRMSVDVEEGCDNPTAPPEAYCFMGKWLELNGIAAAEKVFMDDYNADPATWKAGLNIAGMHYFAYTFLDAKVGSPDTPVYDETPTLSALTPASITLTQGDSAAFTTTGTDGEDDLSGVEWYGNSDNPYVQYVADVSGNGSSANFTRIHTFNSEGIFTITAVAFDTSGNYSSSAVSTVTVEEPSLNACADVYIAGERYRSGDIVENNNSNYQCTSNKSCKNAAYEPGVGTNWASAWIHQGVCY